MAEFRLVSVVLYRSPMQIRLDFVTLVSETLYKNCLSLWKWHFHWLCIHFMHVTYFETWVHILLNIYLIYVLQFPESWFSITDHEERKLSDCELDWTALNIRLRRNNIYLWVPMQQEFREELNIYRLLRKQTMSINCISTFTLTRLLFPLSLLSFC